MTVSYLTLSVKKLGTQFVTVLEKIALFDGFLKLKYKSISQNTRFILVQVIIL